MKTHDYTRRYWGHDYLIDHVGEGGLEIRMMGWGYGITEGDYMLIQSQSGPNPDTRYQVKAVNYYLDPPDMWTMTAVFAPRPNPNSP